MIGRIDKCCVLIGQIDKCCVLIGSREKPGRRGVRERRGGGREEGGYASQNLNQLASNLTNKSNGNEIKMKYCVFIGRFNKPLKGEVVVVCTSLRRDWSYP